MQRECTVKYYIHYNGFLQTSNLSYQNTKTTIRILRLFSLCMVHTLGDVEKTPVNEVEEFHRRQTG